jgi:SAM-dependent methyltransferase
MGSSHHKQVSKIISVLLTLHPSSVLDIGAGYGKYGFLTREYLDQEHMNVGEGKPSKIRVDAMEGFEGYLSPIHKFIYDNVYVGDVLKLVDTIQASYDLVLLIDVLEHFNKEDGSKFLEKLIKQNKVVCISTPKYVGKQDASRNSYEEHKSQWATDDFKRLGYSYFINDPISHIVLIGDRAVITKAKKQLRTESIKYKILGINLANKLYRRLFWKNNI